MANVNNKKTKRHKKIIANPSIVLREETDDWALLYDPDSNDTFGLNPVGVLVWKQLNGHKTIEEILENVHTHCANVHKDVGSHVQEFIAHLLEKGLALETEETEY